MKPAFVDTRLFRRLLFIFGNLAVCAVFFGVIVVPIHGLFADRDVRIKEQRKVLARLTAVAAQAASVESIAGNTKTETRGGEFLVGPNENVISADLQTKLKTMTELAGARSRAVQSLPVRSVDQVRYSGSRIEISGSLQSIRRAVYAVESSKPYLFINSAVLRSVPAPKQGSLEEPVIQVQLDVFGAMQVGERP